MTGQPGAVRPALSDGLKAAGLWLGVALLAASWLAAALVPVPWPAAGWLVLHASGVAIAIGGGLLLSVAAPRRVQPVQTLVSVALLVTGFGVLLVGAAPAALPPTTAAFPLSAAKIALLAFAANAGRRRAPLTVSAALVAAVEALCVVAAPRLGLQWAFDVPEAAMLLLVAAVTLGFRTAALRLADSRRAAAAAADEEALTRTRAIARSRAAAVVHDTVLGDLAALAALPPGPLPERAETALQRTLRLLASPDWSSATPTGPVPLPGGAVRAAIRRAEQAGLRIRVEGALGELGRLDPAADHALAQAVEQCLENTRRHAGTDAADVTVLSDRDGVTLMVCDAGSGFEPDRVDPDRLGLTTAIGARVRAVGGSARVFAEPGVGTTVLLTVPAAARP